MLHAPTVVAFNHTGPRGYHTTRELYYPAEIALSFNPAACSKRGAGSDTEKGAAMLPRRKATHEG